MSFMINYDEMPYDEKIEALKKGMIVIYKGEKCEVTNTAFNITCNLLPLKYKHWGDIKTLPYIHYGVDIKGLALQNTK